MYKTLIDTKPLPTLAVAELSELPGMCMTADFCEEFSEKWDVDADDVLNYAYEYDIAFECDVCGWMCEMGDMGVDGICADCVEDDWVKVNLNV